MEDGEGRALRGASPWGRRLLRDLVLICGLAEALFHSVATLSAQSEPATTNAGPSAPLVGAGEIGKLVETNRRVRVSGVMMLEFVPGSFFLHDSTGDVRVMLGQLMSLRRGDVLEVTGLPIVSEGRPWLNQSEVRFIARGSIPKPVRIRPEDAVKDRHDAQYVTVQGRVVGYGTYAMRGVTNEVLIVDAEGVSCKAMLPLGTDVRRLFPVGTVADFSGICRLGMRVDESETRYLHVLLHGPEAARVVERAPLLAPAAMRRVLTAGLLAALVGAVGILLQRRQVVRVRASEERFRALIENSFDVTMILTSDGNVKYISPSGQRLLGDPPQPLAPSGLAGVVHPDDLPLILEAHREVLAQPGKSKRVSRCRILVRDGAVRCAEVIGTNCLRVPGVEGVVVNLRDITGSELARQELERSEQLQRRINEFATSLSPLHTEVDILWELTRQCISVLGLEDCVIYLLDEPRGVLVQKAAYGPKNPREREIAAPIEIPLGQGIVGSVAASGQAEIIPDTGKDPRYILDDAMRLSEIAVPIVVGGRCIGVIDSEHSERGYFGEEHLTVLTSIASLTANKLVRTRAEAELRRLNQELEQRVQERTAELRVALAAEKELNQLKSSFVSMVSHEFRTPLEVILSSSNILDRYLDRLPPEKRTAQLRAIRKAVHRMNDLVEDVLLLGKFDTGRLTCQAVALNLTEFCRRAAEEIELASGREGAIRFETADLDENAAADEGLLQHILTNLLSNAVKYSPPGSIVDFLVRRHGPDAEFLIRDQGCGIPASDQARLFTAFYRGSNVGPTAGSGLGLVIVKRCVDLHDGTIRCESSEGVGTAFTVTLPLFDGTRRFRRRPDLKAPTA